MGLDRRVRPQRIAEVLSEIDSDVIALQEVVDMDDASHERNHVRAIAAELGMQFFIGENRRLRGGAYGNAILTRFPVIAHHNHDITCKKYEPRGCLELSIELGGRGHQKKRALQIYNVHLGTSFFERRHQADRLLNVVSHDDGASSARIILGDFNEWTRGLTSRLLSQHFNVAEPQQRLGRPRSYPGVFPFFHLDHIYYNSFLELMSVSLNRSRLALVASDHLPLVAEFRTTS